MKEDTRDVDMLKRIVEDKPEDAAAWLAYSNALLEGRPVAAFRYITRPSTAASRITHICCKTGIYG